MDEGKENEIPAAKINLTLRNIVKNMSRQEISYAIRHIDVNKNGMITRGEFVAGLTNPNKAVTSSPQPSKPEPKPVPLPVKLKTPSGSISNSSKNSIISTSKPAPVTLPVKPQQVDQPITDAGFYEIVRKLRAAVVQSSLNVPGLFVGLETVDRDSVSVIQLEERLLAGLGA